MGGGPRFFTAAAAATSAGVEPQSSYTSSVTNFSVEWLNGVDIVALKGFW